MKKFNLLPAFLTKNNQATKTEPQSVLIPTIERENSVSKCQVTRLCNNMPVLTDSITFPTSLHLGFYFKSGTRKESKSALGILHSLNSAFFSHFSKENMNFFNTYTSDFYTDYDRESFSFHVSTLSQETHKVLKKISDIIVQQQFIPKNHENFRKIWNENWHKLPVSQNRSIETLANSLIIQKSLGEGLELPLNGDKNQCPSLESIEKYVSQNFVPENLCVFAGGVYNHHEFLELTQPLFEKFGKNHEIRPEIPKNNTFRPFELKVKTELPFNYYSLAFKGPALGSKDYFTCELLKTIIGDSNNLYYASKSKLIHEKFNFFLNIHSNCTYFSDIGIFCINFSGPHEKAQKSIETVIGEIMNFTNITEEELKAAKKRYKIELFNSFENSKHRLDHLTKFFMLTNNILDLKNVLLEIESIKIDDVKNFTEKMIISEFGLLCLGKNLNLIPNREAFIRV